MSDADTIEDMRKKKAEASVSIHARVAVSDAAEVDKAAQEQPVPVTRSHMLAMILREWVTRRRSPKKPK